MIRSTFNFLLGIGGEPEPGGNQCYDGLHSAHYQPFPKPLSRRSKSFSKIPILKSITPASVTREKMANNGQEIRKVGTGNCEPSYGQQREKVRKNYVTRNRCHSEEGMPKRIHHENVTIRDKSQAPPPMSRDIAGLIEAGPAMVDEAELNKLTIKVAVHELWHFLFFALLGHNSAAMSLKEVVKIIGWQYPNMYNIIQKARLPQGTPETLEEYLTVFFVVTFSNVFVLTENKHCVKYFSFVPSVVTQTYKTVKKFEDVMKSMAVLAIRLHLNNGPVALDLLRLALRRDHPYLFDWFLYNKDHIINVIKKNSDVLKLNDDENTAMLANDYISSRSSLRHPTSTHPVLPSVTTGHGRNCICNKDLQLTYQEYIDFSARYNFYVRAYREMR